MSDNKRWRVRYVYSKPFGSPRHSYEVVGPLGGMHLHIVDTVTKEYGQRFSAGLEQHWRSPPDYMRDRPPSHDECWLLKCPCWHDGTSLYAQEKFVPIFEDGASPQEMLDALCREADERFYRDRRGEP